MRKFLFLPVAVLLFTPAYASETIAVLQNAKGKILISHGEGFAPAREGAVLKSGDKIMMGLEAVADAAFTNNPCLLPLPPGAVTTITDTNMCNVALPAATITPAVDEGVPGEIPPVLIASGIFAIGAGALILSSSGNNRSVSVP